MSMYLPAHFASGDADAAWRVIERHPFAMVVSQRDGAPLVTHCPLVPVRAGDRFELHGHVARANPHHRFWADGDEVLAVFRGPQAYVSPNWYVGGPDKLAVPTWNYVVVHARGAVHTMDDEAGKDALLKRLIARMEPPYAAQWRALPADYQHKMLGAIVGFRIAVGALQAKFKLSQNRSQADRDAVIARLQTQGEEAQALAAWMAQPPA